MPVENHNLAYCSNSIELTGNTQDPKYRYAWIDGADVDNAAEGTNQSRYRCELTAPDQSCRCVSRFLPGRRPHVTPITDIATRGVSRKN